jgi:hypothetical protein
MSPSSRWIDFLSPCFEEFAMAKRVTVYHPQNATQGSGPDENQRRHARHPHFAACGSSAEVDNVNGTLTDDRTERVYYGRTIQQPSSDANGFWIIEFLMGSHADPNTTYTLRIYEIDLMGTDIFSVTESIIIIDAGRFFAMSYPTSGDNICTHFAPYGTSNSGSAIGASITDPTNFTSTTTTLPPTNWVLSCVAKPQNNATFTATQDGTLLSATAVTVVRTCI